MNSLFKLYVNIDITNKIESEKHSSQYFGFLN